MAFLLFEPVLCVMILWKGVRLASQISPLILFNILECSDLFQGIYTCGEDVMQYTYKLYSIFLLTFQIFISCNIKK
jgi:hypothetical protein